MKQISLHELDLMVLFQYLRFLCYYASCQDNIRVYRFSRVHCIKVNGFIVLNEESLHNFSVAGCLLLLEI